MSPSNNLRENYVVNFTWNYLYIYTYIIITIKRFKTKNVKHEDKDSRTSEV